MCRSLKALKDVPNADHIVPMLVAVVVRAVVQRPARITSATLSGRVEDSSGGLIEGGAVVATNLETNQTFTTTTDYQGRFKFLVLRVGDYSLQISAEGFQVQRKQLSLSVGQTLEVRLRLEVSGVSANVSIDSQVSSLETVRTQLSETIHRQEITDLPLNGRNYLDLACWSQQSRLLTQPAINDSPKPLPFLVKVFHRWAAEPL